MIDKSIKLNSMTKFIFLFYILFFSNLLNAQQDVFDILDNEDSKDIDWAEPEQEKSYDLNIDKRRLNNLTIIDKELIEENLFRLANIRFLNKVTTHSHIIDLPLGINYIYDGLDFLVKSCYQSKDPTSGSKALIKIISDEKPFNGWIFSSDPAVNIFEHPIYNVTLIKCR